MASRSRECAGCPSRQNRRARRPGCAGQSKSREFAVMNPPGSPDELGDRTPRLQVHVGVAQMKVDRHLRQVGDQRRQHWCQMRHAKRHRGAIFTVPAARRTATGPAPSLFRPPPGSGPHWPRRRVPSRSDAPGVTTGAAIAYPMLLQPGHGLGHCPLRQADLGCGAGERAGLDHGGNSAQASMGPT